MCHMLTDKIVSRQSTICAIPTNKCHATLPMYAMTDEQYRPDVCQQQLHFSLSYCHSKNTSKNNVNRKPQNAKRPQTTQETAGNKTFHSRFATFRRCFTAQKAAFGMAKGGVWHGKRRPPPFPKAVFCKPIRHISHRLQAPAIAHHDRNNAQASGCQRLTPAHFSTRFSNTDAIIFKTTHSQSVNRNHNESTHAGFVYKCQRHLIRATSPDKITLARQIDEAMSCIIARKDIILHPFYISMTQYKVFRTLQQCNRKRKKTSTGR